MHEGTLVGSESFESMQLVELEIGLRNRKLFRTV